jgi:hypothetical protein
MFHSLHEKNHSRNFVILRSLHPKDKRPLKSNVPNNLDQKEMVIFHAHNKGNTIGNWAASIGFLISIGSRWKKVSLYRLDWTDGS